MVTCGANPKCNDLTLTSNLHNLDHYKLILVPSDLVIRKIKNTLTPKQEFEESYKMPYLVKVKYKIAKAPMVQTIVKIEP